MQASEIHPRSNSRQFPERCHGPPDNQFNSAVVMATEELGKARERIKGEAELPGMGLIPTDIEVMLRKSCRTMFQSARDKTR